MGPDYTDGFALLFAWFTQGNYTEFIIKDDDVTGGQTTAWTNLQTVIFAQGELIGEVKGAQVANGVYKCYGHGQFEAWEAGGFIPAQEPLFDIINAGTPSPVN